MKCPWLNKKIVFCIKLSERNVWNIDWSVQNRWIEYLVTFLWKSNFIHYFVCVTVSVHILVFNCDDFLIWMLPFWLKLLVKILGKRRRKKMIKESNKKSITDPNLVRWYVSDCDLSSTHRISQFILCVRNFVSAIKYSYIEEKNYIERLFNSKIICFLHFYPNEISLNISA